MNTVSIFCYNFVEFILLLSTFLVISFLDRKNIWFDDFSLVNPLMNDLFSLFLPVLRKLLTVFETFCLEVNIWRLKWWKTLILRVKSKGSPIPSYCLLKLRVFLIILIILSSSPYSGVSFEITSFINSRNT